MTQDFARRFYHSKAWERARRAALDRSHGLCEECIRRGLVRPAAIVHHRVPLTPDNIGDPSVTLGLDNLECVCRDCHAAEHVELGTYGRARPAERPRVAFDEAGNVVRLPEEGWLDDSSQDGHKAGKGSDQDEGAED